MQKNWLVKNINKKYFLKVGNKNFACQIGSGGLKIAQKKVEGDKMTPIGKWHFETLYYRPDRVLRPRLKKKCTLKINKITKKCGWCDDVRSNQYNKYIKINNFKSSNISYERLWREDDAYDIMIVISHNAKPTIKKKGSAIFIHCSFQDNRPTSGCIAINKLDFIKLIQISKNKTGIIIN